MKFDKEKMRLYAITDRHWLNGRSLKEVVKESLDGGVTFLQLRDKNSDDETFLQEAAELQELCRDYKVPLIINDNVEIALKMNADGVHVGQSDIKGRDIRAMIGPDKILGISAGTVEEAQAAEKAGADYIGVGAVFGTSTKKNARNLSLEKLQEISSSGGSHWRNQCIQSDGACRQRSRRCSGGICHLCSQGSRSGDQRAESAGTENGGT